MNLTVTGIHYFTENFFPGRKVLVDLSGTPEQFDGLTATFGYKAADGAFSPFLKGDATPVTTTSRGGFECRVPRSGQVGVSLSAAPAGDGLVLDAIAAVEMPPGS